MKVQIEIEIPDGHEVTTIRRAGIYGPCEDKSVATTYTINTRPTKPFVINGVPSDWPEWLTCDYVAKDKNGNVFGYIGGIPHLSDSFWYSHGCGQMLTDFTGIDIPGPWDQSLRENPRRKK